MLKNLNPDCALEKAGYKRRMPGLMLKAGELQRRARELGIPVLVVFEGWDAAGKGTLINKLILSLDPRGFNVHPINPPTEDERLRPFLWRFWCKTPARGRIGIFDRSWYGRVLVERVDELVKKPVWRQAFEEICSFEQQLIDDGAVIMKFMLHISKKEQKKRFKKLLKNPATQWKVTKEDWRHHRQYGEYLEAYDELLAKTHTRAAPWTVVEAGDERFATVKLFETFIKALERKVREVGKKRRTIRRVQLPPLKQSVLDQADLSLAMSHEAYDGELDACQKRLWDLEHEIYRRRIPVLILYEGWDAAGKGGNIRRLVTPLDPRGYEVVPVAAPNDTEKSHHYLWRFWTHLPKAGHITVFDRTWYGRVMVERIEGFCREDEWQRAYGEINAMERQLTDFGAVLVKFWLHIDKDEQLRRFKTRERTPYKRWKITDEDWRNREKWGRYKQAVDEMLARTSPANAPWTVVEANNKQYARIKSMRTVIAAIEMKLASI